MNPHRRRLKNSLLVFLHYYPVFPVLTRKKPQCPHREMQFQFLRLPRMSPIEAAFHQCAPCNGENLPHLLLSSRRPVKRNVVSFVVSGPKKRTKKGPKRIKKSLAQLDQEMEDYRASAADGKGA